MDDSDVDDFGQVESMSFIISTKRNKKLMQVNQELDCTNIS
jgi:hypothetical protein